ncbi:hypothetical protein PHMEG_0003414 [Phytophthora megakarya]|uniref:Reverse transcriptase n=1 Tax=Phytophthora megakarya TaxID=4795 RepID=A0A225WY73_9STRA|nr:hypothetical protein PHMEG_0003414 [Phytophthora megakarya]
MALQRDEGKIITSEADCQNLNCLGEILKPRLIEIVSVYAIPRAAESQRHTPKAMENLQYSAYSVGGLAEEANICSNVALNDEVDESGLLLLYPKTL